MQDIKVMVNGLPGDMATKTAEHAIDTEGFQIIPYSLTGPGISDALYKIKGFDITLIKPEDRNLITDIKEINDSFLSVDYAALKNNPNTPNENAEFYCSNGLPFVMGATGGDRPALEQRVRDSDIVAVIAPNMAKQIVGFQALMEYGAKTFPDLFDGYSLEIKESHQNGKADTSGTAKAMVKYFNAMGIPFSAEDIIKERIPEVQQKEWGIPEEFLKGHGWHTYTLVSKDKTVRFEFTHNVNGRDIYAKGTLDALRFLALKVEAGEKGKAYSMVDVLKGN